MFSDKTVQTYIRAVKTFVSWMGKEGFVDEGMARKIKLPKAINKQVDILSEEEIRTIINALKSKGTNHYRDIAIFTTFIETGVRLSELVNLKIGNIHFDQGILKVLGKAIEKDMFSLAQMFRET